MLARETRAPLNPGGARTDEPATPPGSSHLRAAPSTWSRSSPPVSSTSHQTGTASARTIASVVAKAVRGVVITRAPAASPALRSAISSASSPLATPTACRTPHQSRELSLERVHLVAKDQPAAAPDSIDRLDRLLPRPATRVRSRSLEPALVSRLPPPQRTSEVSGADGDRRARRARRRSAGELQMSPCRCRDSPYDGHECDVGKQDEAYGAVSREPLRSGANRVRPSRQQHDRVTEKDRAVAGSGSRSPMGPR